MNSCIYTFNNFIDFYLQQEDFSYITREVAKFKAIKQWASVEINKQTGINKKVKNANSLGQMIAILNLSYS